jgi:D-serine/D-alanine/glycine transporter
MIIVAYLIYRKRNPELHKRSDFKMPCGIIMSWLCLLFFVFIVILLALEPDTAQALSIMPIWFLLLAGFYARNKRKSSSFNVGTEAVNE